MTQTQRVRRELEKAGLFDKDSDYGGMIGESIMELMECFSKQGHSGYSAMMVSYLFHQLVSGKTLSPLTSDPDEWMDVSEMSQEPMWQNTRKYSCFSRDGGKTWYDLDDPATYDFDKEGKPYARVQGSSPEIDNGSTSSGDQG